MKICTKCNIEQKDSNFSNKRCKKRQKVYQSNVCKKCVNDQQKNRYQKKNPHPVYNNYYSKEEESILIKYYGKTPVYQIQQTLLPHRTVESIISKARKLGLKSNKRRYQYDDNFFKTVNTTNSYFAGLLAADGNIYDNLVSITLHPRDIRILQSLKESAKSNKPISTYKGLYKCLAFNSKDMVRDLSDNFNIIPKKSLILEPPNIKNQQHIANFIRGYIDGDGCFHKDKQLIILGTKDVLNWIVNQFLLHNKSITYSLRENESIYRLVLSKKQVSKIVDFIYSDDNIVKSRKYYASRLFIDTTI